MSTSRLLARSVTLVSVKCLPISREAHYWMPCRSEKPAAEAIKSKIANLQSSLNMALPDGGVRARRKIAELQSQLHDAEPAMQANAEPQARCP